MLIQKHCLAHMEVFLLVQCIIKRNNLIKLAHYDGTKKGAHYSQIIRANESLKFSLGGPSQKQAPGTNQRIKALHQGRH